MSDTCILLLHDQYELNPSSLYVYLLKISLSKYKGRKLKNISILYEESLANTIVSVLSSYKLNFTKKLT